MIHSDRVIMKLIMFIFITSSFAFSQNSDLSELDKYKDCVPENILHSQEYSISNFDTICSENTKKKQEQIMLYSIIGLIVLIIFLVIYSKNKKDWEHIEKNNTDI
jgi:hypothetical protein